MVVDDTFECDREIYSVARRSVRIGAKLVLRYVEKTGGSHDWLGRGIVSQIRRGSGPGTGAPSRWESKGYRCRKCGDYGSAHPRTEQIMQMIDDDSDMSFSILAASGSDEGSGFLILSLVAKSYGSFQMPLVIVTENWAMAK